MLMKRLARAGLRAFKDDATSAAKLNLDVLNREGQRKAAAAKPPAPASAK
ncbi:MAG: hypothetical protein HZA54_07400 [Planctomycetes bacterium]|nr:hypothetical protein [Planctomycetota bacterium]